MYANNRNQSAPDPAIVVALECEIQRLKSKLNFVISAAEDTVSEFKAAQDEIEEECERKIMQHRNESLRILQENEKLHIQYEDSLRATAAMKEERQRVISMLRKLQSRRDLDIQLSSPNLVPLQVDKRLGSSGPLDASQLSFGESTHKYSPQESLLTIADEQANSNLSFQNSGVLDKSNSMESYSDLIAEVNELIFEKSESAKAIASEMEGLKLSIQSKDQEIAELMRDWQQERESHEAQLSDLQSLLDSTRMQYEAGMDTYKRDKNSWESAKKKITVTTSMRVAELEQQCQSANETIFHHENQIDKLNAAIAVYVDALQNIAGQVQVPVPFPVGDLALIGDDSNNSSMVSGHQRGSHSSLGHASSSSAIALIDSSSPTMDWVAAIVSTVAVISNEREGPCLEVAHLHAEMLTMQKAMDESAKQQEQQYSQRFQQLETSYELVIQQLMQEKEVFGAEVSRLTAELQAAQEACETLARQLGDTKASLADEVLRRSRACKSQSQSDARCRELETQVSESRLKQQFSDETLLQLEKSKEELQAQFEQVNNELRTMQEAAAALAAEEEEYSTVEEESSSSNSINEQIQELQNKLSQQSKLIKKYKQQLVIRTEEYQSIKQELRARNAAAASAPPPVDVEAVKAPLLQQIADLQLALETTEGHTNELRLLLKLKQNYIDDSKQLLTTISDELNEKIESLKEQLDKSQKRLFRMESHLEEVVQERLEDMQREYLQQEAELKLTIDQLRSKLDIANGKIEALGDLQLSIDSLNEKVVGKDQQITALTNELVESKDSFSNLQMQRDKLQEEYNDLDKMQSDCSNQLVLYQTQIESMTLRLASKEKDLGKHEEEYQILQADFDQLTMSFEGTTVGLKRHIDELEGEVYTLENKLKISQSIIEKYAEKEEKEVKLAVIVAELDAAKSLAHELRAEVAEKAQVNGLLASEVHKLEEEAEGIRSQLRSALASNKSLEAELAEKAQLLSTWTEKCNALVNENSELLIKMRFSQERLPVLEGELIALKQSLSKSVSFTKYNELQESCNQQISLLSEEISRLQSGSQSIEGDWQKLAESCKAEVLQWKSVMERFAKACTCGCIHGLTRSASKPIAAGATGAGMGNSLSGRISPNPEETSIVSDSLHDINGEAAAVLAVAGDYDIECRGLANDESDVGEDFDLLLQLCAQTPLKHQDLLETPADADRSGIGANDQVTSPLLQIASQRIEQLKAQYDEELSPLKEQVTYLTSLLENEKNKSQKLERDLQTVSEVAMKQMKIASSPRKSGKSAW